MSRRSRKQVLMLLLRRRLPTKMTISTATSREFVPSLIISSPFSSHASQLVNLSNRFLSSSGLLGRSSKSATSHSSEGTNVDIVASNEGTDVDVVTSTTQSSDSDLSNPTPVEGVQSESSVSTASKENDPQKSLSDSELKILDQKRWVIVTHSLYFLALIEYVERTNFFSERKLVKHWTSTVRPPWVIQTDLSDATPRHAKSLAVLVKNDALMSSGSLQALLTFAPCILVLNWLDSLDHLFESNHTGSLCKEPSNVVVLYAREIRLT